MQNSKCKKDSVHFELPYSDENSPAHNVDDHVPHRLGVVGVGADSNTTCTGHAETRDGATTAAALQRSLAHASVYRGTNRREHSRHTGRGDEPEPRSEAVRAGREGDPRRGARGTLRSVERIDDLANRGDASRSAQPAQPD